MKQNNSTGTFNSLSIIITSNKKYTISGNNYKESSVLSILAKTINFS